MTRRKRSIWDLPPPSDDVPVFDRGRAGGAPPFPILRPGVPLDFSPPPVDVPVRKMPPAADDDDPITVALPFADLDGVTRDAAKHGKGLLGFLLWMDVLFVKAGQPPLSDWWRFALSSFFESEKIWGLWRVGRGGGKSTSLVRVAILYVIFGGLFAERKVPPGQRWIWPFISASTGDAARRIREAEALLHALSPVLAETKAKGHQGSRTIEMVDAIGNEVSFLSLAATIAGVSGPSALGGTVDEEAKLRDRAQHVNPATEIIASIAQMFRGRPGMHAIRCSSAWQEEGSHYESIKEGDTDVTFVAHIGEKFLSAARAGLMDVAGWETAQGNPETARHIRNYADSLTAESPNVPTWVANPTISAVASRLQAEAMPLDPSDRNLSRWRVWLRENASVPLPAGAVSSMSVDELEALGDLNRKIARASRPREGQIFRDDGLLTIPGYGADFKPIRGNRGRL